jgi:PAS domain S-box-containing protein
MSLSLRFASLAIGLLLVTVLSVSFQFDRERSAAVDTRELEHMRHHLERAVEVFSHYLERLRSDTHFLASTPPLLSNSEALGKRPIPTGDEAGFNLMHMHLERLFQSFADTRPEYLQLRLIGVNNGGRELVHIERQGSDILAVKVDTLQRKDNLHFVQEAMTLQAGQVMFSRIDLRRENNHISQPETATIRAISPVMDAKGSIFALVVINLDLNRVFALMRTFMPKFSHLYLLNQDRYFLSHPNPRKAMTYERVEPYRLKNEFPAYASRIAGLMPAEILHFESGSGEKAMSAIAMKRRFDILDRDFSLLTFILTEPAINARHEINAARMKSYLVVVMLMVVTIVLVVLITRRLTRSLRDLEQVSQAVSQGDYNVEIPDAPGHDMESLTGAFRHMISTLKIREYQLKELNLTLEHQVVARTQELEVSRAELAREQLMLQSILDHVGDGVVAVDDDGHVLLWNRRAEEILGMGPANLPPEQWPRHFGLYRAPGADLLSVDELPLARALKGEIVRNQELFVHNPDNHPGRWISAFARPLTMLRGDWEGAVGVLVDITEAHNLREQMDTQSGELAKIGRLTLIAQIVDTMAHRLSQPLAAIANYAGAAIQLRASGNLDSKRLDEVLDLITRQAERGGECLRDLRSLRMRGGLPHGKSDINTIIESALNLLDDRLQKLHILVERAFATDLPALYGQKIELQQAMVHLLVNAMESLATTSAQPRILRLITTFHPENNLLWIEIGDNGPGVPSNLREQIFEAWFTSKPRSLGLGLSVAQSIVENHNGSLSIQDHDDDMTWFLIELPAIDKSNG